VKVNTVIIKGVNDDHVPTIAKLVRELGADVLNPIPLYPAEGAVFTAQHAPDVRDLTRIKVLAGDHIPLMTHCARCRADAAGFLGRDDPGLAQLLKETAQAGVASAPGPEVALTMEAAKTQEAAARDAAKAVAVPDPPLPRVRVAAASMEGLLINDLLGKTRRFLIYEMNGTQAQLVGERPSPRAGAGGDRWAAMADVLSDCHTLLVGEAGGKPIQALGQHGIKVEVVEGLLQTVVPLALAGADLGAYRRQAVACGGGCSCGAGGAAKKAKLKPEEGGVSGPALKKGCQCGGGGGGCG
jgi:nitrogen fixation protein NifB